MLSKRVAGRRSSAQTLGLRIAAGVAFLCAAGWLIFWGTTPGPQPIAERMADTTISPIDSATKTLTLAQPEAAGVSGGSDRSDTPRASSQVSATPPPDQTAAGPVPTEASATATATEDVAPELHVETEDQEVAKAESVAATERARAPQGITLNSKERKALTGDHSLSQILSPSPSAKNAAVKELTPASPVGGLVSYRQYLENNKHIPEEALRAGVHGTVIVDFTVSITGEPGKFNVVQGLGSGCEQELIRLIMAGPKWTPATRSGQPEPSVVRVSLEF